MHFKDSSGMREVDANAAHNWQGLLWQVPPRVQPGNLGDRIQQKEAKKPEESALHQTEGR